jgi:hypothetical protein
VEVREAEMAHRAQSQSVKPGARCLVVRILQYVRSYRHVSHTVVRVKLVYIHKWCTVNTATVLA